MSMPGNIRTRLVECFQTIFPDIAAETIPSVSQASTPDWDSVAAITLVQVLEDEFGLELDLDKLADLDSFDKVLDYLRGELQEA